MQICNLEMHVNILINTLKYYMYTVVMWCRWLFKIVNYCLLFPKLIKSSLSPDSAINGTNLYALIMPYGTKCYNKLNIWPIHFKFGQQKDLREIFTLEA